MTMPGEVARCADELLSALRRTEDFQCYDRLRQSVMGDEWNRRLLDRFTHAQAALQMAAMSGHEPREEDTAEFERLSALLYQSTEMTDYLLARMRVQQLVAATMERITQAADISVDIQDV